MRLSLGLETTQKQMQLQKLSPRMIQSMEILQLPSMALQERIEQEISENPTLESVEVDPALPEEQQQEVESPDSPAESEKELVVEDGESNEADFERLLEMDRQIPDHFDDQPRRSSNWLSDEADRHHDMIANIETRPQSLNDFLLEQLAELEIEDSIRRMAERIISTLDARDGGYLRISLVDLQPRYAGPEDEALAEAALKIVQQLEPAGVAARTLQECLMLQIRDDNLFCEELRMLVGTHLDDLHHNRLPLIAKKTGYSIEEIQETWEELRKLNPKPGAVFADSYAPTITPDVIIERKEDGRYEVIVEERYTPTLHISKYYRERLSNGTATAEEREFIKRKINSAQWLIESIEQRRNTLTRVAQAIVNYQQAFLELGPEHIVPLKMQQIADQVGVHVTTVSRAVDDKWVQTPRGIMSLKRFFVGGTRSDAGEDVAWDKIRIKLQEIVDGEDKNKPLSDDELVRQLKNHGLNVARRTVTKYRQKMDIPSSRQRREWKDS